MCVRRLGDGMLVHCRVTPAVNSPVPIYTPGWREALCMRVKCLAQEHNVLPHGQPAKITVTRSGLELRPPDPESSALTIRPLYVQYTVYKWLKKTFVGKKYATNFRESWSLGFFREFRFLFYLSGLKIFKKSCQSCRLAWSRIYYRKPLLSNYVTFLRLHMKIAL